MIIKDEKTSFGLLTDKDQDAVSKKPFKELLSFSN